MISEEFSADSIKQACYELRASDIYYIPPKAESHRASNDQIVIPPGQLVVIITREKIDLPNDVMGRVLSKGQLFSIGLSPVNTYADPGFCGRLGIVLQNNSLEYIRIAPGDAIAKIEFSRLSVAVKKPYRGQHGYETAIWPIPVNNLLRGDDLVAFKKSAHISGLLDEVKFLYGDKIYLVLKRVFQFERRLIVFSICFFLFSLAALLLPDRSVLRSNAIAFAIGVTGSLAAAGIIYLATNVREK